MRRPGTVALSMALVAGLLAGCGSPEDTAAKELRAAIVATRLLAHRFEYVETTIDGVETRVQGLVEDDFRYRTRVEVDGSSMLDEVVFDDALAVRAYDDGFLASILRRTGERQTPTRTTDPTTTLASLRRHGWVLDGSGAPPLFRDPTERLRLGVDPATDARTTLDYVDSVMRTMTVRKFNADALDYRPKEDPFPTPTSGSGITRYDFVRAPVPKPAEAAIGGQRVPSEVHFRRMAVYVDDGRVVRVLEDMDVESRLDDIERNYDIDLEGPVIEQVKTAVAAINVVRRGQGDPDPLRVRDMSFLLADLGEPQDVRLPADTTPGDLSVLVNRGRVATREPDA